MSIFFWIILLILVAIGFYYFNKWNQEPVNWSPKDVEKLLQSWIDEDVDYKNWDYFEACKISNTELENIRQEALDATYLNSPYIESCGQPNERLNENGKELFRELIAKCQTVISH